MSLAVVLDADVEDATDMALLSGSLETRTNCVPSFHGTLVPARQVHESLPLFAQSDLGGGSGAHLWLVHGTGNEGSGRKGSGVVGRALRRGDKDGYESPTRLRFPP